MKKIPEIPQNSKILGKSLTLFRELEVTFSAPTLDLATLPKMSLAFM